MCVLSLAYGRSDERLAAFGMAASYAATVLFRDSHWAGLQWGAFGADLIYLGLLVVIALRSKRFWPLFAAGFQLLEILLHLGRTLDPKLNSWTYATAEVIWTYFVEYAILFGIWGRWKERRRLRAMAANS
jgi:hypothetical protein